MLASWTQQTQPSPTFIQHSFEQWVQLFHQVLSFENSHWAGLGRILGRCLCNHKQKLVSSVYFFLFLWEGFPWQNCKNHFRRNQGCCPEMASFSAQLTSQDVGMCWHMLPFCLQPSPPFTWAMALCHVRGCGAERDTLDKSRHKPGQQGQLPNPRSISLGTLWLAKCAAQLPSLNLLNRLCLSNSDADVQSVGYNSAQSPTNWQLFHGKDPSILCWLSSRLSIALWWKPKRRNPSFCIDTRNL